MRIANKERSESERILLQLNNAIRQGYIVIGHGSRWHGEIINALDNSDAAIRAQRRGNKK